MKKIKINQMLTIAVVTFLCQTGTQAQNNIPHSVFANGGDVMKNNSFQIMGTVGQPCIGRSGSTSDSVKVGFWYLSGVLITSVEQTSSEVPTEFRLQQNYPNPFNPTTTIEFALPRASMVMLKLFDILGREVATLVDKELQPGKYKVIFNAQDLSSGVYVYRLWAGSFVQQRKLVLVK